MQQTKKRISRTGTGEKPALGIAPHIPPRFVSCHQYYQYYPVPDHIFVLDAILLSLSSPVNPPLIHLLPPPTLAIGPSVKFQFPVRIHLYKRGRNTFVLRGRNTFVQRIQFVQRIRLYLILWDCLSVSSFCESETKFEAETNTRVLKSFYEWPKVCHTDMTN